jgi:excisionase family DNA binding protein
VVARTHMGRGQKRSSDRSASSARSQNKLLQPSGPDPYRTSSIQGRRGRGLGGTRADRVPPIPGRPDSNETLLLRPIEVAETLGISRSKVFELLSAQELPSVHIGRSTRIPRPQLEEWIRAQICWQPQASGGLLGRLRAVASSRA